MSKPMEMYKPTQEVIYESIRNQICKGELQPGTELKQVELAQQFGVSRMPIREALQNLLASGLATRLQNRHVVIADDARKLALEEQGTETGEVDRPRVKAEQTAKTQVPMNKIHLLPAREQVAAYLRKAILRQEIREGTILNLADTARQMGVSVTPVREALQLLAAQGLVRLRPNKGAVVMGINEKAIRDHFAVRTLLEGEAAALAARPGSDISEVEEVYAAMKKCMEEQRYSEYTHYNESFHMAIWQASDNPKLAQILASLWNGLSLGFLVSENEYSQISFAEHTKFMAALRAHDAAKARKLMRAHMERSMENLLTNYRNTANKG
ncbi:MAG: GntR family transcriptional regulator [Acidaminococcus provencensis]|jgi:DNA-binding GntR family transcriptional regulator|nr:GntR family transcriptional regulator [Acidaminococcus provencensis]MCH4095855.1 GntR family transcriptional regulator [Acidaminococcus provencensis]